MRELIVASVFSVVVLGTFLGFVAGGWPGQVNSCVSQTPHNGCYCEAFVAADIGKPGVRQPFNTWSNLYALGTGSFLALMIWWYRKNRPTSDSNRMRSTSIYPLIYLPVVIFLGLGSMWFHASLTEWGGIFDQLSMFTFVNFLLVYTIVRMTDRDWVFAVFYPLGVIVLTLIAVAGVPSEAVIIPVVIAYAGCEIAIWARFPEARNSLVEILGLWTPGVVSILTATVLWKLSQTGGPICDPASGFQFHGMWHMLAGVTALFLYFFWRSAPR